MFGWLSKGFPPPKPAYRPVELPQPRHVVLTAASRNAVEDSLELEITQRHEGIVFLLGQTDGYTSLIVTAFRPRASTTQGSFHVEATAMRPVVEAACAARLQVVGQVHTHPREAYHSAGDEIGALIRFNGYVSIVLPDYGTRLPSLEGAAVYMFSADDRRFVQLGLTDVSVVPERLP